MEAHRLQRLKGGERCEECGARKWYKEGGFRYCEQGHRLEGFVEYAEEDEGGFGQLATKSARKKTNKSKEASTQSLKGPRARELYLECLQLILRKQVWWLVHFMSYPPKLEAVVKDLWELRVRRFPDLKRNTQDRGDRASSGDDEVTSDSDTNSATQTLYSSRMASGSEEELDVSSGAESRSQKNWTEMSGKGLPPIPNTLGIIYLSCLLLRLPVRIGQLCRWAKTKQLPYFDAKQHIPDNMLASLPPGLRHTLQLDSGSWQGSEIHEVVVDLARAYHRHYELSFPEISWPSMLLGYLQQLALPVELYLVSKRIVTHILNMPYSFSVAHPTPRYCRNPDAMMVASIIVATKYLFPFEHTNEPNPYTRWRFDWDRWERVIPSVDDSQYGTVTEEDIYKMTNEQLDQFVATQRVPANDGGDAFTRGVLSLFPTTTLTELPPISPHLPDIGEMVIKVYQAMRVPEDEDEDEDEETTEFIYPTYKKIDEMNNTARILHERGCKLSGLSMKTLLSTIMSMERRLEAWAKERVQDDIATSGEE